MSDQLKVIEEIEGEFRQIVDEIFPAHFVGATSSSGLNFTVSFSNKNSFFQNTEYSYKEGLTFFHLTSYHNLFSVLNSRSIRLYNLHNANDAKEYEYSANLLDMSIEEKKRRKKNIYTFSFCPISELQNRQVWEVYGRNFEGVAIVFEIDNNPEDWDNYHLAEIKYSLSSDIEKYAKNLKNLKTKYPSASFDLGLEKIMSFHKEEEWQGEKEVRILTYYPYESFEGRLKFCKQELRIEEGRNRFTEYVELPLWVDNSSVAIELGSDDPFLDRRQNLPENYFTTRPKVVIKNILFGHKCGLEAIEYDEYRKQIERIIRLNFGYQINLSPNLFRL